MVRGAGLAVVALHGGDAAGAAGVAAGAPLGCIHAQNPFWGAFLPPQLSQALGVAWSSRLG